MADNASGVSTKDYYWTTAGSSTGQPVTIDELNNFEYDGTNYLYDMEPPQNNLFWAGNFSSGVAKGTTNGYTSGSKKRVLHNAQFRIQSLDFSGPQFTFQDEPNITHMSYPKSVTLNKEVNITWLEDVYHSVQKYNMDWMTNWYDVTADCFTCGPNGKFRKFDLIQFHYKHTEDNLTTPEVEPLYLITFRGLVPTQFPNYSFNMASSESETLNITYNVNFIGIYYNKNLLIR